MAASSPVGIKSVGVYVPRRRMLRAAIAAAHAWALPSLKALGKGEKSFCGWDEDAITMAVEAGRDCLHGVERAAERITALRVASTTAPYSNIQSGSIVGAALRLSSALVSVDLAGSVRAGLNGIADALQAVSSGESLVIASDKRSAKPGSVQEMLYGSAAAAVRIGQGDDVCLRFLGRESRTVPFVDQFRQAAEKFDYVWEERWIRDEGIAKIVPSTIGALLKRIDVGPERVRHFGLSGGPAGSAKFIAKPLGLTPEQLLPDFDGQIGDAGAAQPLLQLAAAAERAKAGDIIVIAAFAQGCEALAFECISPLVIAAGHGLTAALRRRNEETAYLKLLSFDGEISLDWGMRAEGDNKTSLTQLYRVADQVLGFVGGKCGACGAVQFPRLPACVNCGAVDSQKPAPLSEEAAKIVTFTADWLQYSPSPPLYIGLVQFDAGARLLMEMVDVGAEGIEVGTPLKMCFRIKEKDRLRHYDRYFWKATPA